MLFVDHLRTAARQEEVKCLFVDHLRTAAWKEEVKCLFVNYLETAAQVNWTIVNVIMYI